MRYTFLLVPALLATPACAPRWHSGGERFEIRHSLDRAAVYEDSLCLQGRLTPVRAFTDYGVRIGRVVDDTGETLAVKSFQLFWMKEMRFELEVEAPAAGARTVTANLEFLTRSAVEHVNATLSIERTPETDYRTQLRRWGREEQDR